MSIAMNFISLALFAGAIVGLAAWCLLVSMFNAFEEE